jgi:hypothetical protein
VTACRERSAARSELRSIFLDAEAFQAYYEATVGASTEPQALYVT